MDQHELRSRLASAINIGAGLFLIISPPFLKVEDDPVITGSIIVFGILIGTIAVVRWQMPSDWGILSYANSILGLFLILITLFLKYPTGLTQYLMVLTGIIIILAGLVSAKQTQLHVRHHGKKYHYLS